MLRPVELEMTNFRSFVNTTLIKFPDIKQGAILISGKSKDGSTSSGTGKSSILMAMAYALGFCSIPSTELKSWGSKKKMNVRFRLSDGTNIYDVIRNPKLVFKINGEEVGGTSAGAKEKLDGLLKTSPELVKTLTYRPQREKGMFLNAADSKNKEFLTKILNLDEVEDASDFFNKESSSMSLSIENMKSNLLQLESTKETSKVNLEEYASAEKSYQDGVAQVESMKNKMSSVAPLESELGNIQLELNKINTALMQVTNAKNQNVSARNQIENLNSEIKKASSGNCPTCEREWGDVQKLIDQKSVMIQSLLTSMKSNLVLIKNAEPLLNPDYRQSLIERQSKIHTHIASLSSPLNSAIESMNIAYQNFTNLKRMKDLNESIVKKIEEQNKLILDNESTSIMSKHCSNILNRQGFLGNIFDEVISEIQMRSNDLMTYIPNVSTFHLGISSTSVTKTGKVNKQIGVSMFKDGEERSLKTLSGGQMSASELCSDLAVSETIRKRSGSNLGWVALDEAMDGLDVETKICALEAIKLKTKGLLIVVDHSTEIKESFDHVIEVEFDGKQSYVSN